MNSEKLITKCPHCGGTEGVFTRETYHNVIYRVGFDGSERDNSDMYEYADISGGRSAYCIDCEKFVCRMSTLEKLWGQL